jgi:hypothetical protein
VANKYSTSDKLGIALACLGGIVAIVLYLIEKTPVTVVALLTLMAILFIYPIFHFFKSEASRMAALALALIGIVIFGWFSWPANPHEPAAGNPTPSAPQIRPDDATKGDEHKTTRKKAKPPQQNAKGNSNVQQGTSGDSSPNIVQQGAGNTAAVGPTFKQNISGSNNVGIKTEQLNIGTGGRLLSQEKYQQLVNNLEALPKGTAFLILHAPVTKEMNTFGGQLQHAFKEAGWALPASSRDISHDFRTSVRESGVSGNTADGLHCVTDGSALSTQIVGVLGRRE